MNQRMYSERKRPVTCVFARPSCSMSVGEIQAFLLYPRANGSRPVRYMHGCSIFVQGCPLPVQENISEVISAAHAVYDPPICCVMHVCA